MIWGFGSTGLEGRNLSRERRHRVQVIRHRMDSVMQVRLRRAHEAFAKIAHTLDALSPLGRSWNVDMRSA
jgi:hypothetical protein